MTPRVRQCRNSRASGEAWVTLAQIKSAQTYSDRARLMVSYWGCHFGLDYFVEMVEVLDLQLKRIGESEEFVANFCVPFDGHELLECTMTVIGNMDSRKSFWALRNFVVGDYHPLIQSEALAAMGFSRTVLEVSHIRQTLQTPLSNLVLWGALRAAETASLCSKYAEIRRLIEGHHSSPHPLIQGTAESCLEGLDTAFTSACRRQGRSRDHDRAHVRI